MYIHILYIYVYIYRYICIYIYLNGVKELQCTFSNISNHTSRSSPGPPPFMPFQDLMVPARAPVGTPTPDAHPAWWIRSPPVHLCIYTCIHTLHYITSHYITLHYLHTYIYISFIYLFIICTCALLFI